MARYKSGYRLFCCVALFIFFLLFLVALTCGKEEAYEIEFSLYDVYNNSEIYANQVTIKADYYKDDSSTTFTFEEHNGTVTPVVFSLREGKWEFFITANDFSTPAIDYQIIHSLKVEGPESQRLFLLEVGTVKGIVKDKAGKLVSGAKVKFECSREDFIGEMKTDLFGSFSSKIVPVGQCKVFASYQNSAGISEVEVKKGQVSEVEVYLDEEVVAAEMRFYVILGGVVGGGLILLFAFFVFRRKKKGSMEESSSRGEEGRREKSDKAKRSNNTEESSYSHEVELDDEEPQMSEILDYSVKEEEHKISKRSQDILNSLPEGEQKILRFIIDQGNQTSQARIHRIAKIPKSTLHRNLKSLEEKNLVKMEKKKGRNRVYLTDYFLSER